MPYRHIEEVKSLKPYSLVAKGSKKSLRSTGPAALSALKHPLAAL